MNRKLIIMERFTKLAIAINWRHFTRNDEKLMKPMGFKLQCKQSNCIANSCLMQCCHIEITFNNKYVLFFECSAQSKV
uniref:Uncharacterized protein n=1 Tax=Onchocerca volvulus TaxID=6282 RepID=A0A8R1Y3T4_ONCVO